LQVPDPLLDLDVASPEVREERVVAITGHDTDDAGNPNTLPAAAEGVSMLRTTAAYMAVPVPGET
jgi:hypothetical protein